MVKYNDDAKHVHRPVPCPAYDIAGMEAWLEAMAKEGYLLARDGFFMGFADFEVSKPSPMKYRLQAAKKGKAAFDDNSPEDDELELSEAMGWDYVARRGEFHIYRCADPTAPELNTDPEVQALTIKAVTKRMPNHLISLVLWLVIYPTLFYDEGILRATIATGSAFAIFSIVMLSWIIIGDLRAIAHLRRIRKQLECGERVAAQPYSKQRALRHLCRQWLFILAAIVWVALTVLMFLRVGNVDKPLENYEGEPPFATLADFYPEATSYEAQDFMGLYNYYEYIADPLISPKSLIWRESADLTLPDGSIKDGALTVYYHEMSSEPLAKIVAWEFLRDAKGSKYYEELSLPDLGIDHAVAYSDHFDYIILRDGSTVVMATYLQYGDESLSLADWAQIMADSIKE